MSEYEQAVFISYAWGEETHEREIIVNQLERSLQKRGLNVVRDKRDLGYKGSIGKFMKRIGEGNCVIVVISNKYLRSKNCMFELVEIARNKQFADRVFPVILSDAKIYDPIDRIDYVHYWEAEKAKLNEKIRTLSDFSNIQGIQEELNNYDRFRDEIDRLTFILKDMNTLSPDIHRDRDFGDLYTAIEKRIKENPALPIVAASVLNSNGPLKLEYFEPETVFVPEGVFWMGSKPAEEIPSHETPQHEVFLQSYRMGKYPVTNAQFQEFILKSKVTVTPSMGWVGQSFPTGKQSHPVTGVNFFEALEYCQWLSNQTGRRYSLPNEAQWEKACCAFGKTFYPWGDEFDTNRCNSGRIEIASVNAYPQQSLHGCFDLVGNVRQWTCTLWGGKRLAPDPEYSYPWKDDSRNDTTADRRIRRVVRGSTIKDPIEFNRCSIRHCQVPDDPGLPGARTGFRVVLIAE